MCLKKFEKMDIDPNGEGVKCYKVFSVEGKWPFRKITSPIWSEMRWKKRKVYSTGVDEPDLWLHTEIGKNSFHSFANVDDAFRFCNEMEENRIRFEYHYEVYECLIPADTKFLYCGYQNNGRELAEGYASEKLKIIGRVYSL